VDCDFFQDRLGCPVVIPEAGLRDLFLEAGYFNFARLKVKDTSRACSVALLTWTVGPKVPQSSRSRVTSVFEGSKYTGFAQVGQSGKVIFFTNRTARCKGTESACAIDFIWRLCYRSI